MPTYEYICRQCEITKLDIRSITAPEPEFLCESCGNKMNKVLSLTGISFKGSGFYRNDK